MKQNLIIESSPRGTESVSRKLRADSLGSTGIIDVKAVGAEGINIPSNRAGRHSGRRKSN